MVPGTDHFLYRKESAWARRLDNWGLSFSTVVTTMDTPNSEICWETGTHSCILCYPYLEMKANRKQTGVELSARTLECLGSSLPVGFRILEYPVVTPVFQQLFDSRDSFICVLISDRVTYKLQKICDVAFPENEEDINTSS